MKITNVEIDWMEAWANDPRLKFTATDVPDFSEYVYTKKGNLYFAQHECGLASFFSHDPNNETGFGGRGFELNMADGTTETIKGPWSSRCSVLNMHFPHTTEVTYNRTGGYLDVETAAWLVEKAGGKLVKHTTKHGEIRYVIERPAPLSHPSEMLDPEANV